MSLDVRQTKAGKLPARRRREKVPISSPYMRSRRNHGSSTQHHLAAHEFAVVFAESTRHRGKSRVAEVSTLGPLPHISEHLRRTLCGPLAQGHGMQRSVFK